MKFVNTSTDMVQVVRNAIEGYNMGSIRALAQEPVQNALDAGAGGRVYVDYRLVRRSASRHGHIHLLTVTDSGTTGLKGPILSSSERQARGDILGEGENWAAFEGQGFTRKDDDALGSRGQGKSAFLYHSRPPAPGPAAADRMLICYDTLLQDGQYRFGIRSADPADRVLEPPWLDEGAQDLVGGVVEQIPGLSVPLEMEPLQRPGTRVIVPFLSDEGREAIESGELVRWLERCWWRAIQEGRIQISVDRGRGPRKVRVPRWWQDLPWERGDARVAVSENVRLHDELAIKRLVLFHDPRQRADEISGYDTQYGGVQLLRGGQWIETHGIHDLVPVQHRAGFRGFCEFNNALERELKRSERPQHERFNGRYRAVRMVRDYISGAVREFAQARGWIGGRTARAAPEPETVVAGEFLSVFAGGAGSSGRTVQTAGTQPEAANPSAWSCRLECEFPLRQKARLDWGQVLANVAAVVAVESESDSPRSIAVFLELARPGGSETRLIDRRFPVRIDARSTRVEFWDLEVVAEDGLSGTIFAPEPGPYLLRASIRYGGVTVAAATRRIYVATDPPAARRRPHGVSVAVRNLTAERGGRFNDGDEASFRVSATNRERAGVNMRIDAWVGERKLADRHIVFLPGLATGDRAAALPAFNATMRLKASAERAGDGELSLLPGRHVFRAVAYGATSDEPLARASRAFYVEADPGRAGADLPFTLEASSELGPSAMWRLVQEPNGQYKLRYASQYPLYQYLQQPADSDAKLAGPAAFVAEVCANGLLEWALDPVAESDESRLEQLQDSRPEGIGLDRWADYCERIELLADNPEAERAEHFGRYMERWRECVAFMLDIYKDL